MWRSVNTGLPPWLLAPPKFTWKSMAKKLNSQSGSSMFTPSRTVYGAWLRGSPRNCLTKREETEVVGIRDYAVRIPPSCKR